jgi:hypothetical protein
VFQVGFAGLGFRGGDPEVVVAAHCFLLSGELGEILRWLRLGPRERGCGC